MQKKINCCEIEYICMYPMNGYRQKLFCKYFQKGYSETCAFNEYHMCANLDANEKTYKNENWKPER